MADPVLRPIRPEDDAAVAAIIRRVMPEFGACGPGFAINDPEVDHIHHAYTQAGATYWVFEMDDCIVGGGGIAHLEGADSDICELRKMYFLPEARGLGMGKKLLEHLLQVAKNVGYRKCYLETLTGMDRAMTLYEKMGFQRLCAPMGKTGHFGCDRWYAKELR